MKWKYLTRTISKMFFQMSCNLNKICSLLFPYHIFRVIENVLKLESTLSPDLVKDPAEHKDADHGGADDDRVAEEVPRDAGQGAPQAVLLELHLGGGLITKPPSPSPRSAKNRRPSRPRPLSH